MEARVRYLGMDYPLAEDETVLDCLLRCEQKIPNSCRSGICQSCMMQAVDHKPPASSQVGLRQALKESGYFLSCICKPDSDINVVLAGDEVISRTPATIVSKEWLNCEIVLLTVKADIPFTFRPGQFVHITRTEDGLTRSYSVASLPSEGGIYEFHIRRLPGGVMSEWICNDCKPGGRLELSGPFGSCFYTEDAKDAEMLLVGTGSGLAPLYGITLDALRSGHRGGIRLYHGSYSVAGLYFIDRLRHLEAEFANFKYFPCVDDVDAEGVNNGRAAEIALTQNPKLNGHRVFLCGHPEMVKSTKKKAFLSGASMQHILADPFVLASVSQACER